MVLNIITNEELITSQIVKSILLIVIGSGIIYKMSIIIKNKSKRKTAINFVILIALTISAFLIIKEYRIEASLLEHPEYVQGITLSYCNAFARGEGITFEYEVNGIKYTNCNTFYPVLKDSIIVPGGKYSVKFSTKFPESGRMNFKMKNKIKK